MKVLDILKNCRLKLGDVNKQGWSDDRLLHLAYDGLIQIASMSKVISRTSNIVIYEGQSNYLIPDAVMILRAQYKQIPLELTTISSKDQERRNWRTGEGNVIRELISNGDKSGDFIVYPKPKNIGKGPAPVTSNQKFGIITSVKPSNKTVIISDGQLNLYDIKDYITVEYTYITPKFKITDTFPHPAPIAEALIHYISGMALLDDSSDARQVSASADELNLFRAKINSITSRSASGFSKAVFTTNYRKFD